MDKVDRLGWAEGISLEFPEVRIGIRVSEPGHLPRVEQELLPGWKRCADPEVHLLYSLFLGPPTRRKGTRSYDVVYSGIGQVIRTTDREEAFSALGASLRQYAMGTLEDQVAVRAGVAAWKGRALLLLGGPDTGRSTLLKALVDLGAEYYSDEWALLDPQGLVRH